MLAKLKENQFKIKVCKMKRRRNEDKANVQLSGGKRIAKYED